MKIIVHYKSFVTSSSVSQRFVLVVTLQLNLDQRLVLVSALQLHLGQRFVLVTTLQLHLGVLAKPKICVSDLDRWSSQDWCQRQQIAVAQKSMIQPLLSRLHLSSTLHRSVCFSYYQCVKCTPSFELNILEVDLFFSLELQVQICVDLFVLHINVPNKAHVFVQVVLTLPKVQRGPGCQQCETGQ